MTTQKKVLRNRTRERAINSYGLGKEKVLEFCVNKSTLISPFSPAEVP
jgi:hypothetical protein